jgi:PEP-CTERM motif
MLSSSAHALVAYIDEFRVMRSGSEFFVDTFDDGFAPPSTPAGSFSCTAAPNCYSLQGTFSNADEVGGKLRLDSANGNNSESAAGTPRISLRARLTSNRSDDAAEVNAGLKIHRVFSASALYDFVIPEAGAQYQVRLTDAHLEPSDVGNQTDYLALAVRTPTAGGPPIVRLFEQNFFAGTVTEIDSEPLDLGIVADQIRLTLSHPTANSTQVFASWEYLNGGLVVGNGALDTPGEIFGGETWTRAEFHISTPVPEPQTYAMLLAGIGMVAWRMRHQGRKRRST